MMDGGQVFPVLERGAQGLELTSLGMSQRALIAAIMMHAELATNGVPGEACDALVQAAEASGREVEDQMAHNAVQCADALLRALADPPVATITPAELRKVRSHDKLHAILKDLHSSGAYRRLPPAQADAVEALFPTEDDDIPF